MEASNKYEITQWVDAPIEVAFEYFTVAERMVEWQGVAAELDPRPGGIWRCRYEDGAVARGVFLEIDPPKRLVYSWGFETRAREAFWSWSKAATRAGQSRVEVELTEDAHGTRIDIRHTGFDPEEPVAQGWPHFLGQLAERFSDSAQ